MDPLSWVALAGLNAALASSKASQQARQRKMEADIRAAEIEAAPWTGKAPQTQVTTASPSIWGELAGAGINTLGQAQALQGSGLFGGSEATAPMMSPGATAARQYFEDGQSFNLWNRMTPGQPTLMGRVGG